jgi:hypothetical protein
MKFGKLSLALAFAFLIGIGTASSARAQDHDPGIVPLSAGGSPVPPAIMQSHLTLTIKSAALDGGSTTFDVNRVTGAYTVEEAGGMAHFIELKSMGKLSKAQMSSLEKALKTAQDANPPEQMPSALIEGAPEFTIGWTVEAGKSGSISGPNNPTAAVEGQSKKVKALWDAVTPILNKMSKLEGSLVKNHPYVPDIRTVEEEGKPEDASAKPENAAKKTKTVDLGNLDKPGKEFVTAASKAGLIADGGLVLQPGQKVTFETERNQINGIADMKSTNPDVKITSKVVKSMVPGQDGDAQTVQWTIEMSPKASSSNAGEITASADYQSRNDPAYNFKVGVSSAPSEQPKTEAKVTNDDGVTDAIRNRGKTTDNGPRTGFDRAIEEKLDENKHPERAADDR